MSVNPIELELTHSHEVIRKAKLVNPELTADVFTSDAYLALQLKHIQWMNSSKIHAIEHVRKMKQRELALVTLASAQENADYDREWSAVHTSDIQMHLDIEEEIYQLFCVYGK